MILSSLNTLAKSIITEQKLYLARVLLMIRLMPLRSKSPDHSVACFNFSDAMKPLWGELLLLPVRNNG